MFVHLADRENTRFPLICPSIIIVSKLLQNGCNIIQLLKGNGREWDVELLHDIQRLLHVCY